MTAVASPGAAMAQLWDDLTAIAESLEPSQWELAVPWCPGWSVADLISHLGGLQTTFNGDPQPDPPPGWVAPPGSGPFDEIMGSMVAARKDWTTGRRLDELRQGRQGHIAHLESVRDWTAQTTGPVGPTTEEGLYRVRSFDVWVHLQDLREALGRPVDVHDTSAAAAAAFTYVLGLVPWMYGKRAGAPDGSTMRVTLGEPVSHDSVLHVVNGRAVWDADADAGDCFVTGSPAAFTLLTAGRGSPQRWRDAGVLDWGGQRGEEFVERGRMF